MKGGGSPSAIPEVGPVMTSRFMIQFNNLMPTEGPDAALQGKLEVGKPTAFLPATKTVKDGEGDAQEVSNIFEMFDPLAPTK